MRRLAWALVAGSAALALTDAAITAQYRPLLSGQTLAEHAFPAVTAAALFSTVMGALIVSRYPRHPIGWLLCGGGAITSLSLTTEAYSIWVSDHGGPGSDTLAHLTGWLSILTGASVTLTTLTAIFLLAPDGHLLSRRWRWALGAALLGLGSFVTAVLTVPPSEIDTGAEKDYGPLVDVLSSAGILMTTGALIASVVSLTLRLRQARGVERQQLRWIAASAAALAGGMAFLLVAQAVDPDSATTYSGIPIYLAYLAFPVCTAVAVLRYRLFDLDLIISRALLMTIATALVAVGYVLVVILVGGAVGKGAGGFWPSLLATALVALAFQPLRRWVVRLADRVAYGASAVPYESLAEFSRRLGDSPDPATLLPAVAEASARAVGARRATVRLVVPGGSDRTASWHPTDPPDVVGSTAGPASEVPVVDRGEQLGSISVEMPPGRTLRAADRRLLDDLADQAGIAFRNVRVAAELAGQVEELSRRTRALAESRRRLITAEDVERARLESSIAREVVPHLRPLPRRLAALAGAAEPLTGDRFRPLLASATAALEALREITRGVFPAQLTRSGLEPALTSLLVRTGTGRLVVEPTAAGRRHDPRAEATAYFCVVEAARDLDPPLEVRLSAPDSRLHLLIVGGPGGEVAVDAMRDRVETAGGTVTDRRADRGTTVEVSLPSEPVGVGT